MTRTRTDRRTYLDYPFVGVGVVIWRDDKFLLIQRGSPPRLGQWSIPGGRQELGETLVEAALREAKEETDLSIKITHFLGVVDLIQKDKNGQIEYHATLIDYSAEWISGYATAGSDVMDCSWHGLDDLKVMNLWDETTRVIKKSAELRSK